VGRFSSTTSIKFSSLSVLTGLTSEAPRSFTMPSLEATSAILAIQEAVSPLERTESQDGPIGKDDKISKALYEVFKRIPQVRQAMRKIIASIRGKKLKDETQQDKVIYHRVETIATGCCDRTRNLEKIFMQVAEIEDIAELKTRYESAVGRGEPVETLMKGTVERVLQIVKQTPGVVSREEVEDLEETLKAIESLESSLEEDTGTHTFNNYGSGPQSIHVGSGHQNINTGSAPQFIGQFHAPFQFTQAPFQGTGGTAGAY